MPQPAAVNFVVVLTDPRTGHSRRDVGAMHSQWCRRQHHAPLLKFGMIDPLQHAAFVHVLIVHHLTDIAYRAQRNSKAAALRLDFRFGQGAGPGGDDFSSDIGDVLIAVCIVCRRGSSFRSVRPAAFKMLNQC